MRRNATVSVITFLFRRNLHRQYTTGAAHTTDSRQRRQQETIKPLNTIVKEASRKTRNLSSTNLVNLVKENYHFYYYYYAEISF